MGNLMKHQGSSVIVAFFLVMAITVVYSTPVSANLLVTKEEAMSILGDTVAEPTTELTISGMAPPGQKYHYSITGASTDQSMSGSMVIHLYDSTTIAGDDTIFKTAQDYFDRRKKAMLNAQKRSGRIEVEEVSGIGESAYWASTSDTLHFISHDAYVSVKINDLARFSGADRSELEKKISTHRRQLAEKIADLIIPRLEVR
jgi:hypothetical protein